MHNSAYLKARFFVETYAKKIVKSDGRIRVIEIGSKSYDDQDTLRTLFDQNQFEYTGLDVEAGLHVDIVPTAGFVWKEIENDSFDVCVSGQTFEHNPYFWVTFCEMMRVLRPGGYLFVSAPGAGAVHRYPYDCWRFYPDSWRALCSLTGVELVESYFERDSFSDVVSGGVWRDSCLIARKPALTPDDAVRLNARLAHLTAPFADLAFSLSAAPPTMGPCFNAYEAHVAAAARPTLVKRLRRSLRRAICKPPRVFAGDGSAQ